MELNPLTQVQPVVIAGVIGVFLVTYAVLRKVFFLPYIAVMEERESRLERSRESVRQAEQLLSDAETRAEAALAEARERAEEIRSEAVAESEKARREIIEAALQESGATLERGRAEIAKARESELSALRQQATECVGLACRKLLGEIEPATVEGYVDKLIAGRVQ